MSDKDWARLKVVMELLETDNTTDTVKDALRLLEYFVKTVEAGGKFYKKMPDEEQSLIEIFGIST
ncbi:hypothetical protein [uncultured Roseovarius sp.]|uniref:hypothetical protein n=1 Tax=uncultured Roseovarius sp. TaxID=293344 RepID=UPI002611B4A7|nr:hypothetical protein [uncultured Roseovarius sp.]